MASGTHSHWLGQHSRSIGITAGILAGVLVLVAGIAAILAAERMQLAAIQSRASQQLAQVVVENRQLLTRLQQDYSSDCSEANLTRLRLLLLQYNHIRGIGLRDAQGNVMCSTNLGRLAKPYHMPPPDLTDAGQVQTWQNFPFRLENQVLSVGLAGKGSFITLADTHVTTDTLRNADIDALWLNHRADHKDRAQLVWSAPGMTTLQPPTHLQQRYSGTQQYWSRVDWQHGRMIVGSNIPETGFFIQSYQDWRVIASQNAYLLLGLVLLAVLTGTFGGLLLARRLQRMTTLNYRIGNLCRPEHIICMYQPIVELASGRITGCEVLMRLQDGDEVIFPDRVIPLILEQKLGWALDSAVSERALRDLAAALPATSAAQPFKVALNFFPDNISHARLHALLQPLQHECLAINVEVTEYGMSDNLFDDVARLRADRYLISVDDFGTGYSNLGTVKRLAPDFLKIDRSFVHDMEDDTLRASLIPEIVAIASAVQADIIAEGVENAQQAGLLRKMGVRYGQGYWFGRPVPLAAFLQMLAEPPKIIPAEPVASGA